MKDKLIADFEDYVQSSKLRGARLHTDYMSVQLVPTFCNDRTFTDIGLIFLVAYGTYTVNDKNFYLIPIIAGWVALILMIWYDLKRINTVSVDLTAKKMQVVSRNFIQRWLIKYLFRRKFEYDFSEIASFITVRNSPSKADFLKYFIKVRLKDRSIKLLFVLPREGEANTVAAFLTGLVKD